ncbi:tRNA-specific 2-thiouridylase, partial [Desulfovibrio sp.]
MTQLAVAVSGGVDSLCALLRLREQGHDVLALHGLFLPDAASSGLRPAPEGPCLLTAAEALAAPLPPASRQAVEGLQTACGQLGIPLHVADMRAVFDREVVTPFVRAYARGRTPNPCALCNRAIKFGALLDAALSLGADRIATGHYARLLDGPAGPVLAAADDLAKDQSYFLSLVPLERLRRAVFPLARQDKAASIAQVKDAGLAVPVPQESQEICFIPAGEDAYRAFLERRWQAEGLSLPGSGPVLLEEADSDGRPVLRPLARHEGLWRYTEGQRRGLGIAHSEPLYVLRKQGEDNTLVVGGRARLGMRGCLTGPANLLCPPEQWPDTLLARLRHRQRPTPARV